MNVALWVYATGAFALALVSFFGMLGMEERTRAMRRAIESNNEGLRMMANLIEAQHARVVETVDCVKTLTAVVGAMVDTTEEKDGHV